MNTLKFKQNLIKTLFNHNTMDGKLALETITSFKTLLSPEDFDAFVKGEDSAPLRAFEEVKTFLKGESPASGKEGDDDDDKGKEKKEGAEQGGEEEDLEKKPEIKKAQTAVDDARAGLQKAEADLAKLKNPAGAGDTPVVTSVTPEMFKAFQTEITTKFKAISDLLTKSIGSQEELTEIKKAVGDIAEVKDIVERIAGMPLGGKAIRQGAQANFLEKALKGEQTDDDGKKVLSINVHKQLIEKALEDAMLKTTDEELKKSYEDSLLRYNAGGGTINQDVAFDLFNNHNIRLTK